jgi:hypothetical protein
MRAFFFLSSEQKTVTVQTSCNFFLFPMKVLTIIGIVFATLITVIFKFVLYDNQFFRTLAPHTQLQDCKKITSMFDTTISPPQNLGQL